MNTKNKDTSEILRQIAPSTENYYDIEDTKHIQEILEREKEKEKNEPIVKRQIVK